MSALIALRLARDAGVEVRIDQGNLALRAAIKPPDAVIDMLTSNKAEILSILTGAIPEWSAQQWRQLHDEQVSIARGQGLDDAAAQSHALDCCLTEWLNRHPQPSLPSSCHHCGGHEDRRNPLIPSLNILSLVFPWEHISAVNVNIKNSS